MRRNELTLTQACEKYKLNRKRLLAIATNREMGKPHIAGSFNGEPTLLDDWALRNYATGKVWRPYNTTLRMRVSDWCYKLFVTVFRKYVR